MFPLIVAFSMFPSMACPVTTSSWIISDIYSGKSGDSSVGKEYVPIHVSVIGAFSQDNKNMLIERTKRALIVAIDCWNIRFRCLAPGDRGEQI